MVDEKKDINKEEESIDDLLSGDTGENTENQAESNQDKDINDLFNEDTDNLEKPVESAQTEAMNNISDVFEDQEAKHDEAPVDNDIVDTLSNEQPVGSGNTEGPEALSYNQEGAEVRNANVTKENQDGDDDKKLSSVSIPPRKQKLFFILFILLMLGAVYYAFFMTSDVPKKEKKELTEGDKENIVAASKPVPKLAQELKADQNPADSNITINVPKVSKPKAPPPPPPPPVVVPPPAAAPSLSPSGNNQHSDNVLSPLMSDDKETQEEKQARINRMKVSIMVAGGGSSSSSSSGDEDGKSKDKDKSKNASKNSSDFLGFGDGKLDSDEIEESDADNVEAKTVKNLHRTITQGKIIDAVLETAINTDIPGMLRAVVSRDVYADHGDRILLPMGSRLIGDYQSGVVGGQTRVAIMWNRIIRPDGIDIDIKSQGVDSLGRAGAAGKVYDHLWERLGNAFMVSFVVPVSAAEVAQKATKSKGSTTTTQKNGTTVTTESDPVADAIKQSTDDFSKIAKDILNDALQDKPTITVDQGTRINVFVQRDLIFPSDKALQKRKLIK